MLPNSVASKQIRFVETNSTHHLRFPSSSRKQTTRRRRSSRLCCISSSRGVGAGNSSGRYRNRLSGKRTLVSPTSAFRTTLQGPRPFGDTSPTRLVVPEALAVLALRVVHDTLLGLNASQATCLQLPKQTRFSRIRLNASETSLPPPSWSSPHWPSPLESRKEARLASPRDP